MQISSISLKIMKIKFSLFFVVFVVALFGIIAWTSVRQLHQSTAITAAIAGMPVLELAANFIDGDKFERLAQTVDPSDPFYLEMQEKLRELKSYTQCVYLYAMAPYKEGVHRFIFDAGDPDSEGFSPLGTEEDISDYDLAYFETYETKAPQFTHMSFLSAWGRLTSSYVPILNSQGDSVGIIGIDFDGEDIYQAIISNLIRQIGFVVIFITAGLFFYFLLLKDMTRQNEDLLNMSRKAEAASRAKSDFLANMSHEIRTPMNAILGLTHLLLQTELDEQQNEYTSNAHRSAQALLSIINDILDFSKVEAGKMTMEKIPFSLSRVMDDIAIFFHEQSAQSGVDLVFDEAAGIPDVLLGDPMRLRQIFINLVGNSFKFTKEGSITVSAGLTEKKKSEATVSFAVKDTGVGMTCEQSEKLFQAFTQADTSITRQYGGTGLGLTITKSLVQLMNGAITVKSEPGRGTTMAFHCVFGLDTSAKPAEPAPARAAAAGSSLDLAGHRVLLVEDNDVNVLVARSLLKKMGLEVTVAENGEEALARLEEAVEDSFKPAFDAVLMDLQMPVMDGYEATRRIRADARYEELVIIAMTAHAFEEERERCLASGMNGHISKPIDVSILRKTLREAIIKEI
jgi:signal transduction histidine kinase/CheY-like chemotaxis protein